MLWPASIAFQQFVQNWCYFEFLWNLCICFVICPGVLTHHLIVLPSKMIYVCSAPLGACCMPIPSLLLWWQFQRIKLLFMYRVLLSLLLSCTNTIFGTFLPKNFLLRLILTHLINWTARQLTSKLLQFHYKPVWRTVRFPYIGIAWRWSGERQEKSETRGMRFVESCVAYRRFDQRQTAYTTVVHMVILI